jgi:hypothetical protein
MVMLAIDYTLDVGCEICLSHVSHMVTSCFADTLFEACLGPIDDAITSGILGALRVPRVNGRCNGREDSDNCNRSWIRSE